MRLKDTGDFLVVMDEENQELQYSNIEQWRVDGEVKCGSGWTTLHLPPMPQTSPTLCLQAKEGNSNIPERIDSLDEIVNGQI